MQRLGPLPEDPGHRARWLREVSIIAAYRDRWRITGPAPIDNASKVGSTEQMSQFRRAFAAAEHARAISQAVGTTQVCTSHNVDDRSRAGSRTMSKRRQAKALMRWSEEARQWATAAGRALALDLYFNRESNLRPYEVGVVLDPGEKVWAEAPVRFNLDWTLPGKAGQPTEPAVRAMAGDIRSGRRTTGRRPAIRLPVGICSWRPRGPNTRPRSRTPGHRRRADAYVVRPCRGPDLRSPPSSTSTARSA